jgi:selenium metabolism protein YedF
MLKLDYRQFQCPYPVVETRKQLLANPGQSFLIQVGDRAACENVGRLAAGQGYAVAHQTLEDGFALTLVPAGEDQAQAGAAVDGRTILFCKSDRMGDGDPELGRLLLKNFLMTLTELDQLPDTILFVNSGVKLACHDSEALEALNLLAGRGVDIAACGLCLEFYHLKDQLRVGRVTNMLEIAASQLRAGRIITP